MNSVLSSVRTLMQMFDGKTQEFISEIDNVHMVWLEEIQQEANRMFSRDFNAEPELMPKTPSQKKNSRRKRVSVGRQEENQARRRFSKGRRSNLRGSSVKSLNLIAEEETVSEASTSEAAAAAAAPTQPKRTTRRNKQRKSDVVEDADQSSQVSEKTEEVENKKPEVVEEQETDKSNTSDNAEDQPDYVCVSSQTPPKIPSPEVVVRISPSERLSAELSKEPEPSPGRTATKITIAGTGQSSRRSSVRHSLKLRHSLAGLRHSMTQESVRRASRRSMLKRKVSRAMNSTCSSNVDDDACMDFAEEEDKEEPVMEAAAEEEEEEEEESKETPEAPAERRVHPSIGRVTRSVAANSPKLAPPSLYVQNMSTPNRKPGMISLLCSVLISRSSTKRKAPDTVEESPTKRFSPPKKSQSAIRPHMKSFLHTVQKNQMLMMTPNTLGRSSVIKSFIKHTTPMKSDSKTKERHKLEALKKKQELEEERMKKMEEEKKKKQEELKRSAFNPFLFSGSQLKYLFFLLNLFKLCCRKRDERLRKVLEAKVKEEQREEEKKKKIEQKMAQIDENKRLAEEKAKKKAAIKRQEELENKKKMEEEARRRKIQQAEEEKRQQELLAKKKAEEEEQARKLAEARRALEVERERLAAAERERVEREKALALQRELERAAREKERRELEEKRKALEEKRKLEEKVRLAAEEKAAREREAAKQREAAAAKQTAAVLNKTMDTERSVLNTPVGKGAGLNVTVDIEKSPQSYAITPKGGNKPLLSKSAEDYGMDQNSDDSTDDESAPRKPIPSWAEGHNLQQIIMKQYFNPPDLDLFFGKIEAPNLENIFYKSKPRYFKRTSSAVWHSPPMGSK
ncbi:uncharacterized protein V6R79_021640 [Siganus canaliculatus]